MPIEMTCEEDSLVVLRISEKLKISEFQGAQRKCEDIIKEVGDIKILVITSNFEGWERAQGWSDWTFSDRNDTHIKKIAIVGDAKWKDLVYAFTAKDLRPVAIEYFDSSQEFKARRWLESS